MGLSIEEVNRMDYEEFTKEFGNVVEHCSLFAASIWAHRPFSNLKHIHSDFGSFIDQLPSLGP
jgi:2-oxo-4-hydroxy-4-carboxy--5-ureidoimidazoline (OHCU) decarboxylase